MKSIEQSFADIKQQIAALESNYNANFVLNAEAILSLNQKIAALEKQNKAQNNAIKELLNVCKILAENISK